MLISSMRYFGNTYSPILSGPVCMPLHGKAAKSFCRQDIFTLETWLFLAHTQAAEYVGNPALSVPYLIMENHINWNKLI